MHTFYQMPVGEVLAHFGSSDTGLDEGVIAGLREKYGENKLAVIEQKSRWKIFISQFKDVMIIILIIAAAISFIAGEHTDGMVILAIIIANAWMGYSQENNAENSVRVLRKMSSQFSLVLRNNNAVKIDAGDLVPGDIILLHAGDIVPADARLISIHSLKTDESSLTGESIPADKQVKQVTGSDLMAGDQINMVFKGTHITNGTARAVVTATGMETELGRIAGSLSVDPQQSPLQKRLGLFSKQLAIVVIVICAIVLLLGIWRGMPFFQTFLTALSLAVAALPEALPAVITIALAQGARRMAGQKALMKNLPSVETLGSVNYVCTDKTGTLTENRMNVEKAEAATGNETLLFQAMLLNHEVRISEKGLIGDPTETALVKYALEKGIKNEELMVQFPLVTKLPFDSDRMVMSTFHQQDNRFILFVKGAPGKMLEKLRTSSGENLASLREKNEKWASEGLRVLFFGYRAFDQQPTDIHPGMETDLEFLGAVAMIDPPRAEAIESLRLCRQAGIRAVMITGDQPLTAQAIARRLELAGSEAVQVTSGADLAKMSEPDFEKVVNNITVYARVSPHQKLSIITALQKNGAFVAMTGDGVNDAPSLKQADIGIAMGITGTDVSKEAADMILLDDNFSTIVKAIREGRRIYDNIRKFILYVLSCNLAEILIILSAPLLGFPIPLLPVHILWINLVTDGLPGIALVAESGEADIMSRPPRKSTENVFAGGMIWKIVSSALLMTIGCLIVHYWSVNKGYSIGAQQTMVFTTLCFIQLANALSVRSSAHLILTGKWLQNKLMLAAIAGTILLQILIITIPFLQKIFKTASIDASAWSAILLVTAGCVLCFELIKEWQIRMAGKRKG